MSESLTNQQVKTLVRSGDQNVITLEKVEDHPTKEYLREMRRYLEAAETIKTNLLDYLSGFSP